MKLLVNLQEKIRCPAINDQGKCTFSNQRKHIHEFALPTKNRC
jgi:hypothetical protein